MGVEALRRPRRHRRTLDGALLQATSEEQRACAHFALALFHDNNSGEAEAIPHYEAALALGLQREQRAQCLAWLASSLYKTGSAEQAANQGERGARRDDRPKVADVPWRPPAPDQLETSNDYRGRRRD